MGPAKEALIRMLYRGRLRRLPEYGPARSLSELVDFAQSRLRPRINPWQVRSELLGMLEAVRALRPQRMLEIGTARGGTLFLFTRVAAPDATLISIDLPGGEFGGGYAPSRSVLYRAFALSAQRLHLLQADSHAPQTAAQVRALLGDAPLDFLFIDGDHSYDGVKKDFETYAPWVRSGGMVALHDIAPVPASAKHQVARFWLEVRERHAYQELVENPEQGRMGIGLLRM